MSGAAGRVRPGETRDIPAIMTLLVQVGLVHHKGRTDLFGSGTKYTTAQLSEILGDESTPVFVFEDEGGDVLGHAFCVFQQILDDNIRTPVKTLYIDDICVDEAHRGQQVGKALYDHVLAFAREQGCYNVTLNVWSCNPGAMRFYQALGMVPQKVGMETILVPEKFPE